MSLKQKTSNRQFCNVSTPPPKKYMSLNQANSELTLSLEQMRFHENDYFFNGYEAIIDPGVSIVCPEDLDNYIHHNE